MKGTIKHFSILIILLGSILQTYEHSHSHTQINEKINNLKVMYGSTIRIKAVPVNY